MHAPKGQIRLGVDLGGTKIEAALLDESGNFLRRERVSNPGQYADIRSAIAELCDGIEAAEGLAHRSLPLGIGTPGSVSARTGLMRNCNSTQLNGRNFPRDLQCSTQRAVRVANDADCFTLSEARDGAARGLGTVFGVILGTGVGGGIALASTPMHGANRIAGEWGHNRMPLERCRDLPPTLQSGARRCYCGELDCVEVWLSGPGLAQTHQDLHGTVIDEQALHCGDIAGALESTLEAYCELAGAALAGVVNTIDPDAIVLGGGLSNVDYLYSRLPGVIAQQVFSDCFSTPILRPRFGDSSGVRGAAWLW